MAKRRKVNNLLALAVLSLAAERPMHPYEMASMLRERGNQNSIKIHWGSLYTVVGNLEKHGFLEATETVREGRRPERTVYTITDAGQAELRDWLRELLSTPEKEYRRFEAALSLLGGLPPDEVSTLLTRRLATLDAQIAEVEGMLAEHSREIPRLFLIEAEYDLAMLRAEAGWTRSLQREIDDGSLPGVAQWRSFHETGVLPPEIAKLAERGRPPE